MAVWDPLVVSVDDSKLVAVTVGDAVAGVARASDGEGAADDVTVGVAGYVIAVTVEDGEAAETVAGAE